MSEEESVKVDVWIAAYAASLQGQRAALNPRARVSDHKIEEQAARDAEGAVHAFGARFGWW